MPLSSDPEARARQLANLRPGAGAAGVGNGRALVHGGRSTALPAAGSWAERIADELAREAPLRAPDGELPEHDRRLVEVLALALARLQAVTGWLDARPPMREDGTPWPAEETASRLRREVAKHLDALGMSPASRARLGVDLVRAESAAEALWWDRVGGRATAPGDVIEHEEER